jgi:hypothetical protein
MAKVSINHILAKLGSGEINSKERIEKLARYLRETDEQFHSSISKLTTVIIYQYTNSDKK